ncbi:M-phase inducer phosphatase-like [Pecten maximus]|uniref:M-phase inducer phosphatase-like n=1 Tax=Pecten maximus TaxID=6579 RepID=UPI001458E83A|nr:M-phase inducer phosphatase-like [Pecten maximus]
MRPNRSRTRLTSTLDHVVTPSVRKSLLRDFMTCDVQEQEEESGMQVTMVTDESGSLELGHLSLDELDAVSKSPVSPIPKTPEAFNGSCLELLAPRKSQQDSLEERTATITGPNQRLPRVRRSLSFGAMPEVNLPSQETDHSDIRAMVEMLSDNDFLIGDGSASHHLTTVAGKHIGIKCVSSNILSETIRNKDKREQIRLVDCRYPYEYTGGHIQGAECLYSQEQILNLLEEGSRSAESGRTPHKLVFYCEFSSVRAPSMYRFLREKDRALNRDKYPSLIYPEIYLLDGGYQAFFQSFKELCTPSSYVPMRSQSHLDDLRHFRAKSKSWTAGEKRRLYLKCLRL